jgi:hypothetical protein
MRILYKQIFLCLLCCQISLANDKFLKNCSVTLSAGAGIYSSSPFNASDPRNFSLLDYYNLDVSKSRVVNINSYLSYPFNNTQFVEAGLGFQNQKIVYVKSINSGGNLPSPGQEKYDRRENTLLISSFYGINIPKSKFQHQFSIGVSLALFERIKIKKRTDLHIVNANNSNSIANDPNTIFFENDEILRFTNTVYLSLKSKHSFKIKKQSFATSPQINLLVYQPNRYEFTNLTRGVFQLQIAYTLPLINYIRENKPKYNKQNALNESSDTVSIKIDTIAKKNYSKNYFLFFSTQIGGPGLFYLLNSEIRCIQSKFLRVNFNLSYSSIVYNHKGINAIVPGLNFSLIRKKWKTEFGIGMISILDKNWERDNTITFKIARFLEFGKGYCFKFGLTAFNTISYFGGSSYVLVWPFISIGKCYQLSDL